MAKPAAKQTGRQVNYYGLESLGYAESIPVTGDWLRDQLSIEFICFRIGLKRSEGGLDKYGHFVRIVDLLWNNPDLDSPKKFVWNPWAERTLKTLCENDEVGIAGPASSGKCCSPEQEVLMFDGSIKKFKDVRVGDVLMGDDWTPRNVLETHSGHGPMYRVTPKKGDPWECSGEHILMLQPAWDAPPGEFDAKRLAEISKDSPRGWITGLLQYANTPHGVRYTPIKVESIGDAPWVGFSVDGNHRHLLGDFTVTHNSDPVALWCLVNYIVDPTHTLVFMLSTTLAGAKKRIFKTFREYWEAVPNLPGNPRWSTNEVLGPNYNGEGCGQSSGVYLLASEQSSEKNAMDKLVGLKAPRTGKPGATFEELIESPEYSDLKDKYDEEYLRDLIPRLQNLADDRIGKIIFAVDEATGCSPSINSVYQTNLKPGNSGHIQAIMISNPASPWDTHGAFCKPVNGWDSVTVLDYEWETASGGICIRFDSEQNPRIVEKNEKYSWMPRKEDLERLADTYGANSPFYWRMVKGMWCPSGSDTGVYSEQDFISTGAMGRPTWGYETPTLVCALDPSFTSGGDRASCTVGKIGKDTDGKKVLEIVEEFGIPVDVADKKTPVPHQVVRAWKKECIRRGILPANACYDATGGGISFGAIVSTEWSMSVQGISSGGKASKVPVGLEKKPNGDKVTCDERYSNKATEIWFGAMPLLRSGQIKGVTEPLAKEICQRQYDKNGMGDARVLKVESKRVYKSRHGSSPDMSDSFFLLVEHAKTRHGLSPVEKGVTAPEEEKSAVTWKSFVNRARKVTIRMGLARIFPFLLAASPLYAAPAALHWDVTPAATSYRVYRGIDVIAEVTTNAATVDLPVDVETTLTVTAVNAYGESDHSDPLVILPVTPESTVDLIAWKRHTPFFVKKESRGFFQFRYPKP